MGRWVRLSKAHEPKSQTRVSGCPLQQHPNAKRARRKLNGHPSRWLLGDENKRLSTIMVGLWVLMRKADESEKPALGSGKCVVINGL